MSDENPNLTPAATEGDAGTTDNANSGNAADTQTKPSLLTGEQSGGEDPANAETEDDPKGESGGDDKGKEAGGDDQAAPEAYTDFTLPEGVELDGQALEKATPVFKELGLTQEQAQRLVDLQAEMVQEGVQKQTEQFSQLIEGWQKDAAADKEFGGEDFNKNVGIAQQAIAAFGTPELKQLMEDHGVGNHPEMIRFMWKVGLKIKQDVPGNHGSASEGKKDRASIMYPNS